jgi:murein DD-endopeptidase MepM/ murein hydrolase activator NlpD
MNWLKTKGALTGLLAGGLAACSTTPAYPTDTDQAVPSQPVVPRYPIVAQAQTTAPQTGQPPVQQSLPAESAPAPTSAGAPSSSPVQSTTLPPVAQPSQPTTTPTPVQPQRAYVPMEQARPTPPPMRQIPARYGAGGQVIKPRGMYRDYVVQRHDHLDAIARDLETTPDDIIDANRLRNPNHLSPGQHLKIPVEKAYVAESGDTLSIVAQRFSVSPTELADINDLSERARLRPGDQIALPSRTRDRGPVELSPARLASVTPSYPRPYQSAPIYPPAPSNEATPRGGVYTPGAATPGYLPPVRSTAPSSGGYIPSAPAEANGPALSETQIAALAHNRFVWPLHGEIINGFGAKGLGVRNDGVDLRSPQGSVVHAAAPGEVVYAGNQIPGYGNLVLIQHADGWVTAYAHLSRASVQMRQHVDQGQEIGEVGTSGGVVEPQLHFEIRYKASAGETARPIDPLLVLPPQTAAG